MQNDLKNWKQGRATISRQEYGEIVARETHKLMVCAELANADKEVVKILQELILDFSASVATEVFNEERTLEVDDDDI